MKMYKISTIGNFEIEEFEVIKKSDKSVWFKRTNKITGKIINDRELKKTMYYKWVDSYQEARNYIIDRLKFRIAGHKNRAVIAETELKKFE